MDFNQLLSKMQELDTPATESVTDECGMAEMPSMAPPPAPMPEKDKARMNINISAEGDAIDDVLKLMTKVNPDMINQKDTPLTPPSSPADVIGMDDPMGIMAPGMAGPMDGPDELPMPKPINKILPDFDADNDDMPGGEKDMDIMKMLGDKDDDKGDDNDYDDDGKLDRHEKDHDDEEKLHKTVDRDNDGDHDMDDHDAEKKEAYANEPDEDYDDIEYLVNKLSGGMNRQKRTHPKVSDGDNPMQATESVVDEPSTESTLRDQIRTELLARLAEAKGEK